MARGGARNRSGPAKDPNSERSKKAGFELTALPSEGRVGDPPTGWPLGDPRVYIEEVQNGKPVKVLDVDATAERKEAELALWAEVWTYPQAVAWEREPWRWNVIALYVRTFLICAGPEAKAADKSSLHRFADQIGLSPAGLRENGWAIANDELGARRVAQDDEVSQPGQRRRRLRAVNDD